MTSEPMPSPHGNHRRDTYPELAGIVAVVTGVTLDIAGGKIML